MKLNRILFIVMIFCAVNCFAQETKWTRIEFENNSFSIALPSEMIVDAEKYDKDNKLRIWSYHEATNINLFVSEPSGKPKEQAKQYLSVEATETDTSEIGNVFARKILFNKNYPFSSQLFVATKKYLYSFLFSSNLNGSRDIARFLGSLKISGKVVFATDYDSSNETEKVLQDSTLKSSPEVLTALNRVPNNLNEPYKIDRSNKTFEEINISNEITRYPIYIRRPYLDRNKIKGKTISVRIQLRADGSTGDITAFSNADDKAIAMAVEATRNIRFLPAQLNGKNVDSYFVFTFEGPVTSQTIMIIK